MASFLQQNIPPPQQPVVDNNGVLTKAGLDFFLSILNQAAQQEITDSVATAIAATGTTIATAVALTSDFNRIDSAPGGTGSPNGVILQSRQPGQTQKVVNNTVNSFNVYAPSGVTIDALASSPYILAAGKQQNFEWVSSSQIKSTQLG